MRLLARLRAGLLLGAILVFGAPPAIAATGDLPELGPNVTVGRLPAGGGTFIVRPVAGAPLAAIELWYRAPSTGFGPKPLPALARLAAQVVAASKPIVGDPLGKTISNAGGRLGITVYGDSIAISAIVPAAAARSVVKALTTAYFAPVFTDDGYRAAQRDVAQESQISAFDPETVVRDTVFAQLFTSGPQHFPSLGDPKDVLQISSADAKAFATRAFRSQNAILVVSGAVEPGVADAAVGGRPEDSDAAPEAPIAPEVALAAQSVTKNFVEQVGGYGWIGPAIASAREATAMDFIADYLFRTDDGYVTRRATEKFPDALLLGQFITLHDPGVMFVVYSAKGDTTKLRQLIDDGFSSVQKPLDAAAFASALESFKYHLLTDLQTPTQMADNFGWYSVEGAAEYAPGVKGESGLYFQAADALTPDFIAAVAQKYFAKAPVSVTLRPDPPPEKGKTQ
jgi:predicted Zn-dependent peptidase